MEKIEIEEEKESKFDDLQPRTELAEIKKEDKEKIVEEEVKEVKEETPKEESKKGLSAFGMIITIIYTLFALYVCFITVLGAFYSISDLNIINTLIFILVTLLVIIPYIWIYKAHKKKDNKLYKTIVIYEIVLMVVSILFFYFVMWPKIKSSINDQWRCITGPCP